MPPDHTRLPTGPWLLALHSFLPQFAGARVGVVSKDKEARDGVANASRAWVGPRESGSGQVRGGGGQVGGDRDARSWCRHFLDPRLFSGCSLPGAVLVDCAKEARALLRLRRAGAAGAAEDVPAGQQEAELRRWPVHVVAMPRSGESGAAVSAAGIHSPAGCARGTCACEACYIGRLQSWQPVTIWECELLDARASVSALESLPDETGDAVRGAGAVVMCHDDGHERVVLVHVPGWLARRRLTPEALGCYARCTRDCTVLYDDSREGPRAVAQAVRESVAFFRGGGAEQGSEAKMDILWPRSRRLGAPPTTPPAVVHVQDAEDGHGDGTRIPTAPKVVICPERMLAGVESSDAGAGCVAELRSGAFVTPEDVRVAGVERAVWASCSTESRASLVAGALLPCAAASRDAGRGHPAGKPVVVIVIPRAILSAEIVAAACGSLYRAGALPIVAAPTAEMAQRLLRFGIGATDTIRSAALARHAASMAGPRARLCALQLFTRLARAAPERRRACTRRRGIRRTLEQSVFTELGVDVLMDGIPSVPVCAGETGAVCAYDLDAHDVAALERAAQRCVASATDVGAGATSSPKGARGDRGERRTALVRGLSRLIVRGGILRSAYPLLCVPWIPPRGANAEADALREESALRAGVVINVRRRSDRMERSSAMLRACGLANVRRFDAVTPGDWLRYELARKSLLQQREPREGGEAQACHVSESELACAASHAIVWDAVSRAPDSEWFLVLEDDALPARELGAYECGEADAVPLTSLAARVASLHPGCGWVSLATNPASRHLLADDGAEPVARTLSPSVRWGTTAYLLRARGARYLKAHARLGVLGVDAEMMLVSQALDADKSEFVAATAWAGMCTVAGTAGIWQQNARESDLESQRVENDWPRVLAAMKDRAAELECTHWCG